jgi:hypothetical protein
VIFLSFPLLPTSHRSRIRGLPIREFVTFAGSLSTPRSLAHMGGDEDGYIHTYGRRETRIQRQRKRLPGGARSVTNEAVVQVLFQVSQSRCLRLGLENFQALLTISMIASITSCGLYDLGRDIRSRIQPGRMASQRDTAGQDAAKVRITRQVFARICFIGISRGFQPVHRDAQHLPARPCLTLKL